MKNPQKCSHKNFLGENSDFTPCLNKVFTQDIKSHLVFKCADWLGGPGFESCYAIHQCYVLGTSVPVFEKQRCKGPSLQ